MRILQLTSHLDIGGVSRYVLSLSQGLQRHGHQVVIAADHGRLEEEVRACGAQYWHAPLHTSAEFSPAVWAAARRLAVSLQREPVEIIHAHTRVAQVVADRLARRAAIPYVTTWHGVFRPNLGRMLWPCMGDRTIAISEAVRQHLSADFRCAEAQIRLIENGADINFFLRKPDAASLQAYRKRWDIPEGVPVIGSIGRLASGRVKGFDLLLVAAEAIKREVPDLHVLLVGDGPRRPFLEEKALRAGLRECVHFADPVTDTRVPLALMDVFVFPSRWPEGFGLSLVEAMAAGRPVVATAVGAVPQIIEHGRSGWVVAPEHPAALADGILRLLKDRAVAAQLAREGAARVRDRFSLDRMVSQIELVYRELVARGA